LWLHSLKVAQLLRSTACLHTNQSRSYLNHLVSYYKPTETAGVLMVRLLVLFESQSQCNLLFQVMDKKGIRTTDIHLLLPIFSGLILNHVYLNLVGRYDILFLWIAYRRCCKCMKYWLLEIACLIWITWVNTLKLIWKVLL